MSDSERLLAMLADVREPAAPVAELPWLWLLNAALALSWLLLWAWRRHRRRSAWRRATLAALDALPASDGASRLTGMATVLRRAMRDRLGEAVATLTGDAWLEVLDRRFDTHWFTRGEGRIFGAGLYRRHAATETDVDALQASLRRKLRSLSNTRTIELPVGIERVTRGMPT